MNFAVMKKAYHICLSSGDEVCCRDEEDYVYYFNALALAVAKTESSLLADAVMSNHVHECLRTACPKEVATMQRYTYTRYFNSKYLRRGSLFLRPPFIIELEGLYHKLAALSYTLRNPVHHGVTATPFEYRHSSARALFRDALGRDDCQDFLPEYLCHRYLPDHRSCPSGYKMGKNGLILRENVLDVSDVEHMFMTPRSFLYYMNRLSGEEWQREQEKDLLAGAPITLDVIESGIGYQSMSQMLAFEHGRADYRAMDDLALCEKIDNEILPAMGRDSVYMLLPQEKVRLAEMLCRDLGLPRAQVVRCLAMNY